MRGGNYLVPNDVVIDVRLSKTVKIPRGRLRVRVHAVVQRTSRGRRTRRSFRGRPGRTGGVRVIGDHVRPGIWRIWLVQSESMVVVRVMYAGQNLRSVVRKEVFLPVVYRRRENLMVVAGRVVRRHQDCSVCWMNRREPLHDRGWILVVVRIAPPVTLSPAELRSGLPLGHLQMMQVKILQILLGEVALCLHRSFYSHFYFGIIPLTAQHSFKSSLMYFQ